MIFTRTNIGNHLIDLDLRFNKAQPLTAGISKKLVTIFARHLDSFIVKPNLSAVNQIHQAGSGQFLEPGQIFLSPGMAKIAPWCLARQDRLSAKEPGQVTGVTSPPTLSAHTRNR
jgi:hypothetical protein